MPPEIWLSEKGIARAEQSNLQWDDRVFRNIAARNHLLAWLYNMAGSTPTSLEEFSTHPRSIVNGYFLSVEDIQNAAAYLCERELTRVAGKTIRIAARGVECMEKGGNVAEYLSPNHDQAKNINYGPITAGNVVIGDNAKPTAVVGRMDVNNLRNLADAINHVIPNLHLAKEDEKAAQEATSEIISQTSSQTPNSRRMHAALTKLRDLLVKAGDQAFVAAVEYQLERLGLPKTG